ncbi:uncharacterized protein Z519_03434 [Cladophialophora bantiana CBS 173.52]|uniref:BZIP domain-containing protein n=1 Tax=Cladophialophora bantiana (strain ATCC 10958 / CBS 173.52 / CDC B-1940 / NIH 8579) TaxID=1442370 RepID=A0A0D2HZL4_CLAB1|nr:uncharacterized protein Z519_03434 [Cladophialophora bantiana CBS 173.52]KIW96365.1 hypothetical protein Z519_03434 [Cladophialophora bantiana CBS 173.52]
MSDIFRPLFRSVEGREQARAIAQGPEVSNLASRESNTCDLEIFAAQRIRLTDSASILLRTFRERRDQYLRVLEKSVRRLQVTEARLQNEVNHLEQELAATKSKLAQCEAELRKTTQATHYDSPYFGKSGYASGSGEFNLASEMRGVARPAYLSPPNGSGGSGAGASSNSNSSSGTLVWIETQNGQPVQMHVQQKQEFGFLPASSGKNVHISAPLPASASSGQGRNATAIYVAQLDAVVVAMEFVLKYVRVLGAVLIST